MDAMIGTLQFVRLTDWVAILSRPDLLCRYRARHRTGHLADRRSAADRRVCRDLAGAAESCRHRPSCSCRSSRPRSHKSRKSGRKRFRRRFIRSGGGRHVALSGLSPHANISQQRNIPMSRITRRRLASGAHPGRPARLPPLHWRKATSALAHGDIVAETLAGTGHVGRARCRAYRFAVGRPD